MYHFQQVAQLRHTVVGEANELCEEAVVGDLEVVHELAHEVGHAAELPEPHLVREHVSRVLQPALPAAAGLREPGQGQCFMTNEQMMINILTQS